MARAIRLEYAGAVYHVMARGNRGDPIFRDVQDRRVWLETLGEACQKTGWRIHAYVLMGNHYHLLLETPEANLVEGMKWLQGAYTQRHNTRHKVHVWSSYPFYLRGAGPAWLERERELGSLGLKPSDGKGYEAYMEGRVVEDGRQP